MSMPLLARWRSALRKRRLIVDLDANLAARAAARRPAPVEAERFERARPMVERLRSTMTDRTPA